MFKQLLTVFFIVKLSVSFATDKKNILFIGNSYTHYNNMPKIFDQLASSKGYDLHVEMFAKSSHTCKMHSERKDLYEKIGSKKWDYVVFQGFSRELFHRPAHLDTSFLPYFNRIIDSIYSNYSCTNVLLYQTWGYKNGYEIDSNQVTYQEMSDRIAMGYQYVSDKYALPIVPVGQVWETVKTNNPSINLYTEDNQHPSLYGSYLVACTFFTAILKSSPIEGFKVAINEKDAEIIQQTAYDFVTLNIERYMLKMNTVDVRYEKTPGGKYLAYCKAYYPQASNVKWEFGDRETSNSKFIVHSYRLPGFYNVKVTVYDKCGEIIHQKKVYFKPEKAVKQKKI
jgi:hypothetical protein